MFQSETVSLRSVAKGFLKAAIPALALSFVAHSGALATTYVLLTAIAGPIIARVIVPVVNLLRPAPPQPAAPS